MRAYVYNSDEEFELDGPVKLAYDPVCGDVLRGEGAFFCLGEKAGDIAHSARAVMSAFGLKEGDGSALTLSVEDFANLASFLHQMEGFATVRGSALGTYITSYEKVNRLLGRSMFWHLLLSKGLLLTDTHFMEQPFRTSFPGVWQRVAEGGDKSKYNVESLLFLPSKSTEVVSHAIPYVYSSNELVGVLGLFRSQMEGVLETYTEKMTIRAAAFSKRVEELLSSDFVDVVYVQTPDLYQDAKYVKEIRELLDGAGAPTASP